MYLSRESRPFDFRQLLISLLSHLTRFSSPKTMTKTPTSHHGKTPEKSKAAAGASSSLSTTVSTKSKSTAEKKASDKKKKPSVEAPHCIERRVSTTFPTAIIRRRMYLHRHHSNQDWSEGRSGITFAWAITPVLESILATTIIKQCRSLSAGKSLQIHTAVHISSLASCQILSIFCDSDDAGVVYEEGKDRRIATITTSGSGGGWGRNDGRRTAPSGVAESVRLPRSEL